MTKKLTKEDVWRKARKSKSWTDFQNREHVAYKRAKEYGIADEICKMLGGKKRIGWSYWTHDRVIAEGRKYDTKQEFNDGSPGAVNAARHNGWYEEATAHMKPVRNYYSYEECAAEAQKYNQRMEFKQGSLSHYTVALNHGWLQDICSHMDELRHDYSLEECRERASAYNTRSAFQKGDPKCYSHCHKNGLLDDVCKHMKRQGVGKLRKVYAYEFADGCAYIGLTCDIRRRQHAHLRSEDSPVYRHIQETKSEWTFKELTDWIDKDTGAFEEDKAISQYKSDGWTILNRMRGGNLGSTEPDLIDKNRVISEARNYDRRIDFSIACPGCYKIACEEGFLDEACAHMKSYVVTATKEEVFARAAEIGNNHDFIKQAPAYYNIAVKHKYLKELKEKVFKGK